MTSIFDVNPFDDIHLIFIFHDDIWWFFWTSNGMMMMMMMRLVPRKPTPSWAPTSWALRNREATAPASEVSNQDIPSEKSLETAIFSILSSYFFQNQDQTYSSLQLIFPAFSSVSPFFSGTSGEVIPPPTKKKQPTHPPSTSPKRLHRTSRPRRPRRPRRGRETVTYQLFGFLPKRHGWFSGENHQKIHHGKWWGQKMVINSCDFVWRLYHWAKLVSFLEFTSI